MREPLWVGRATVQAFTLLFFINQSVQSGRPTGHGNTIMKEENKNEELQSRRSFFKNAAKAALPILGAIALAHMPAIAKASESNGQNNGCYGCEGACWSCTGTCNNICKGCSGGCSGTCLSSCYGGCYKSCTYK